MLQLLVPAHDGGRGLRETALHRAGRRRAHLHAVGEHDAHGHEPGEDFEQLRVGQHAVLQTVVQEARVVTQHVVDVGRLRGETAPALAFGTTLRGNQTLRGPGCCSVYFCFVSFP